MDTSWEMSMGQPEHMQGLPGRDPKAQCVSHGRLVGTVLREGSHKLGRVEVLCKPRDSGVQMWGTDLLLSQFGRTEVIDNTLNPDFVRKFILDYFFEERENLRFDL